MDKSKRILRDIILFAIASFGPKVVGFLLVPLYTDCLSTEVYGTVDVVTVVYQLLLPVITLDISDAIMIYTVEQREICVDRPLQIGMRIVIISSALLFIVMLPVVFLLNIPNIPLYCAYIFLQFLNNAYYYNYLAYLRGRDQVGIIVTAGLISTISIIVFNVLFILTFKWGVYGFLASNALGVVFANIYVTIMAKRKLSTVMLSSRFDSDLFKKMVNYSAPLIPTGIAWWINSSSDRVFIVLWAGVSLDGIYAVAMKIPTIISACHSIIYQALQLSVLKEVNSDNDKSYLKKLYNIYTSFMVLAAGALIYLDIPLAKLLYKKDFFIAWHYVPALIISTVFFSVSGYVITIAEANKKSKLIAKATLIGALVNTVCNIILIPRFMVYGAVIATVIGYCVIWVLTLWGAMKELDVIFDVGRSVALFAILVIQWCVVLFSHRWYVINAVLLLVIVYLCRKEIKDICTLLVSVISRKKRNGNTNE